MDITTIEAIIHDLIITLEDEILSEAGAVDDEFQHYMQRKIALHKDTLKYLLSSDITADVSMPVDFISSCNAIFAGSFTQKETFTAELDRLEDEVIMYDGCEPM